MLNVVSLCGAGPGRRPRAGTSPLPVTVSAAPLTHPENISVALGRVLFHMVGDEPQFSKDWIRACAGCHPDGRDDGLTWSTLQRPPPEHHARRGR